MFIELLEVELKDNKLSEIKILTEQYQRLSEKELK